MMLIFMPFHNDTIFSAGNSDIYAMVILTNEELAIA